MKLLFSFLALAATASAAATDSLVRGGGDIEKKFHRAMGSKDSKCEDCPHDVYYAYKGVDDYHKAVTDFPDSCVLAAIRDDDARAGAQYAIPPGLIAITQGYFPIDDYLHECFFDDQKSDEGKVKYCKDDYEDYFVNYEDTDVVDDGDCWKIPDYKFDAGAILAAIGSDGKLRPVKAWDRDTANSKFGWDGAVYECCPQVFEVCNVFIVDVA